MAMQLTPEQEERLQAVVKTGAYPSTEEALKAALAAVEGSAAQDFEGTQEDLEALLMEGVESRELSEEEFWESVDAETTAMAATFHSGQSA